MNLRIPFSYLVLPAAFLLLHCGGGDGTALSAGSTGTGGTGGRHTTHIGGTGGDTGTAGGATGTAGAGGAAPATFPCGATTESPAQCKLGVELCKLQDSAGPTAATCEEIPAACASGDVCSCTALKPGCDLGDAPGAFSCTKGSDGSITVECSG